MKLSRELSSVHPNSTPLRKPSTAVAEQKAQAPISMATENTELIQECHPHLQHRGIARMKQDKVRGRRRMQPEE